MKSVYNSYVSEEFAKKLLKLGFRLYVYNTGTYDGKPAFFTVDEDDDLDFQNTNTNNNSDDSNKK